MLSADVVRRVEISSLRFGAVLGSGGQGRVVAVDNYLIDDQWPAVLKTYNDSVSLNVAGLEKIVPSLISSTATIETGSWQVPHGRGRSLWTMVLRADS